MKYVSYSKVARANIKYDLGLDVDISSVYKVLFYTDNTKGEVQKSKISVASRSTWRLYE